MNEADCEALGEHYVKTVNTVINSLSANPTKNGQTCWNSSFQMNCLSVFDYFVGLLFKGLGAWEWDISLDIGPELALML